MLNRNSKRDALIRAVKLTKIFFAVCVDGYAAILSLGFWFFRFLCYAVIGALPLLIVAYFISWYADFNNPNLASAFTILIAGVGLIAGFTFAIIANSLYGDLSQEESTFLS